MDLYTPQEQQDLDSLSDLARQRHPAADHCRARRGDTGFVECAVAPAAVRNCLRQREANTDPGTVSALATGCRAVPTVPVHDQLGRFSPRYLLAGDVLRDLPAVD